MTNQSSDHHFSLAVNLSIEALKALLLLNGGAATALITLTKKSPNGVDFSLAVLIFGFGVFLTVVAMAAGYFSQLAYSNHRLAIEQDKAAEGQKQLTCHKRWQYAASIVVGLSLMASLGGMYVALRTILER